MIRLSRVHHPVHALGYGVRAGIWMQGCSIACRGCVSTDTWDHEATESISTRTVLDWIADLPSTQLDGVTISGGEPFEQPDSLHELVEGIRAIAIERPSEIDVLCYSGLPLSRLNREFMPILRLLDAVIPGPFIDSLPTRLIWRGSANQDLIPLSDLGRHRYAEYIDHAPERPPMQVEVDEVGIWWIGIPARTDMDRLRTAMADRGVIVEQPSWEAGSRSEDAVPDL